MNFQSDTELDQLLRQLEQLASKPSRRSKHRASNAMVKAALDDIIQLCYRDANAVTAPNRIAALEF